MIESCGTDGYFKYEKAINSLGYQEDPAHYSYLDIFYSAGLDFAEPRQFSGISNQFFFFLNGLHENYRVRIMYHAKMACHQSVVITSRNGSTRLIQLYPENPKCCNIEYLVRL